MMRVVYIAVPSRGVVNGNLTSGFIEEMAILTEENRNCCFISPMLQNYQLLGYMRVHGAEWADWEEHCTALIKKCDEMWVIKYRGWEESTGVKVETSIAKAAAIPVVYKESVWAD